MINSDKYFMDSYIKPDYLDFRMLVCVNNITGLYLSKNYNPIRKLISLARSKWNYQNNIENIDEIYDLLIRYLNVMEEYLNDNDTLLCNSTK